jgi:hypothetical protein
MPFLAVIVLLPLLLFALMPVVLIQRYRLGIRRRSARPWLARINVYILTLSAATLLMTAAAVGYWVPDAFVSAAGGMAVGAGLGAIGLWLSRWERSAGSLHYTPNRWLVLGLTALVAARILYGFIRGFLVFEGEADSVAIASSFGIAGSMAVGALVIGYYLAYAIGVRRRLRRWQKAS